MDNKESEKDYTIFDDLQANTVKHNPWRHIAVQSFMEVLVFECLSVFSNLNWDNKEDPQYQPARLLETCINNKISFIANKTGISKPL